MAVVGKLEIGQRVLIFRRGNYSCRRVFPFYHRGPWYLCWSLSWCWGQVSCELKRWL